MELAGQLTTYLPWIVGALCVGGIADWALKKARKKKSESTGSQEPKSNKSKAKESKIDKAQSSPQGVSEDPRSSEWMIKGIDKDFGPYSYEQILAYYEKGKLRPGRECYSTETKEVVLVEVLVQEEKKAA